MQVPMSTVNLPLFFLTAWLMSNRDLTDKLKYNLNFSMRLASPVIWRFWLYDLLFSSMALPIAVGVSHAATFSLFSQSDQSDLVKNLWVFVYPLCFALLGFFWPKFANVTLGSAGSSTTISIAALRDRFLGGPMLQGINDELGREIEEYLDRLLVSIQSNPEAFAKYLCRKFGFSSKDPNPIGPQELEGLRTAIAQCAAANFVEFYEEVCQMEMIPFRDRAKPLMKVPQMTSAEERLLYEAGIQSVWALCLANRGPVSMSPERWRILRTNARRRVREAFKFTLGFVLVVVCVTGLGLAFSRMTGQPLPQVHSAGAATVLTSPASLPQ
ncbi:MAG: hypothetical protein JO323_06440 [Acidobacteriia bacterium]|nr:hypothetical protein [Terriglobia bacterium]